MNRSSGIKRGLAATAVAALAVTGIPFAANANPIDTQVGGGATDQIELYNASGVPVTTKPDGSGATPATVRLQAGASSDVTSVTFQVSRAGANTYTDIATVNRNDDGSFFTEWNPANFVNLNVDLRVIETGDATVLDEALNVPVEAAGGPSTAVDVTADSQRGVFTQPYAGSGRTANLVVVNGTTSGADGDPVAVSWQNGNGADRGASTAITERETGDAFGTFAGVVTLGNQYNFGGGADELVVKAQDDTQDFEGYTLYNQQIGSVTAVADRTSVPSGSAAQVTVTVLDNSTTPSPIAGAEVRSSAANNAVVGYTDAEGQVVLPQTQGTVFYYANATDSDPFEANLGDQRSADVTVTEFVGGANRLIGASEDGSAFDFDEYQSGDLTVQVADQAGGDFNPPNNQVVEYFFVVDPFDGTADVRIPAANANPNEFTAVDGNGAANDGEYVIELPANAPAGNYTLNALLTDNPNTAANDGIANAAVLTFKVGNAAVEFTPDPANAAAGGEVNVTGSLELEDGTGLPGRDVDVSYARDLPAAPPGGDAVPDAGIRAATGAALVQNREFETGTNGTFTVVVDDPAENPQGTETGTLTGIGEDPDNGNAPITDADVAPPAVAPLGGGNGSSRVVFSSATPPAGSTLTIAAPNTGKPGQATAASVQIDGDPATPGNQAVANQLITLTIGGNAYFTDGQLAPGTVGQPAAVRSLGQSITVTTDSTGLATFQTSIGRSVGFDDDGLDTAVITATAGSVTDTETENYNSANATNGGTLELVQLPTQINPTDPTLVGDEVRYKVRTNDQFGNASALAATNIMLTYTGPAAEAAVPPNAAPGLRPTTLTATTVNQTPDIILDAASAGTVTVNGTWQAPRGQVYVTSTTATPAAAVATTATASEVFYEIDFARATYSITSNAQGTRPVGAPVTVTVRVVDQEGRGVRNLEVDFIRSGPGNQQDGDPNADGVRTNANGEAFYSFVGTEAGVARVSAVITQAGQSQPIRTLTTNVTFGQPTPPPNERTPITAVASGQNNGAANDRIRVRSTGQRPAARAQVRLFKKQGNRRVLVNTKRLNAQGRTTISARDTNGARPTTYWVVIGQTTRTESDRSRNIRLR